MDEGRDEQLRLEKPSEREGGGGGGGGLNLIAKGVYNKERRAAQNKARQKQHNPKHCHNSGVVSHPGENHNVEAEPLEKQRGKTTRPPPPQTTHDGNVLAISTVSRFCPATTKAAWSALCLVLSPSAPRCCV